MLHQLLSTAANLERTHLKNQDHRHRSGLVNILENSGDWTIEVLAPGYEKSDIAITVEDDQLIISSEAKENNESYLRREFFKNAKGLHRNFKLSNKVDASKLTASLEKGILSITLPKAEEAKPKEIVIH